MPLGAAGIRLTNDELAKWLIEDAPVKIQIARVWPFRPVAGDSLSFATTAALTPASPIDQCAAITENTPTPKDPNKNFPYGYLATQFQICYSALDRFSVPNDLIAVYRALAIRQLLYKYFELLDTGVGANPGEFDSLLRRTPASKALNLAAAIPTLENYDDVFYRVVDNDGQPTAIMGNTRALRRFLSVVYAAGLNPEYDVQEVPDPVTGTRMMKMVSWHGVCWYINDMIPTRVVAAQNVSNVYFMVLGDHGEPGPGHGVTGIIPAPFAGTMFRHRPDQIEGASTYLEKWTWPVGLAVGSDCAVAILQDARVL